jgi:hypothetical protein
MYILIALMSMTTLGEYNTYSKCEDAIRQIYIQRIDPYNVVPKKSLNETVYYMLKYDAPKKYRCQKVGE